MRAPGGDRGEKDSMTGRVRQRPLPHSALCPKAIPVGDKITVSNRFLARAPPQPQQPPGTRNALVSMVSFAGSLTDSWPGPLRNHSSLLEPGMPWFLRFRSQASFVLLKQESQTVLPKITQLVSDRSRI